MIDLKASPFFLDDEAIRWVNETKQSMTVEEKIGQLFVPIGYSGDPGYLEGALLRHHVGGIMYRCGDAAEMQATHRYLQTHSRIPLLIGANLEDGGVGIAVNGTAYGKQMQAAAAGDEKYAYYLGKTSCAEGKAVGCNWAFAPVVDIDMNWRNPITNVRTYGADPEKVLRFAKQYLRAAKEENVLVAVKHFPGDGSDEVDQHILTSVSADRGRRRNGDGGAYRPSRLRKILRSRRARRPRPGDPLAGALKGPPAQKARLQRPYRHRFHLYGRLLVRDGERTCRALCHRSGLRYVPLQ